LGGLPQLYLWGKVYPIETSILSIYNGVAKVLTSGLFLEDDSTGISKRKEVGSVSYVTCSMLG